MASHMRGELAGSATSSVMARATARKIAADLGIRGRSQARGIAEAAYQGSSSGDVRRAIKSAHPIPATRSVGVIRRGSLAR